MEDFDYEYHKENLRNMELSYVVDVLGLTNRNIGALSELDPDELAEQLDITVDDIMDAYPEKVEKFILNEFGDDDDEN